MANQTYLVTGGCGFLGQYIVQAIHTHDPQAEIRVLDLKPRSTLLNIESIPQVKLISGDLRQPESFASALAGVDTVVHSAGLISFKQGDSDALRHSNIVGMENLLQTALAHQCQTFLFISSISAVGRQPNQLSTETMFPEPEEKRLTDPYGYSKLCGEHLLQASADNIRGLILNPSLILGPGSHRIAKTIHYLRWIPFCPMITTLNSFVDVRDVAAAVVLALEKGRSGERYLITTENMGMVPFMKMLLTGMGKKAPVFPVPTFLLNLYDFFVWLLDLLHINPCFKKSKGFHVDKAYSTQKITRELGWRPTYSIEHSLHDTISFCTGEKNKDEFVRQDSIAYRRI
ncbi:MAG: NAD-dependent epimerase/dehydratase family protein [Chloroflexi bacterium]|nr:NAD-dependent epimerase/dehydratase family protein [Chloroflexota bacterium]